MLVKTSCGDGKGGRSEGKVGGGGQKIKLIHAKRITYIDGVASKEIISVVQKVPCFYNKCWEELVNRLRGDLLRLGIMTPQIMNPQDSDFRFPIESWLVHHARGVVPQGAK